MSWSPERRARMAELVRTWAPWERSTGPATPEGKARSSRNAWKGGSRQTMRELSRLLRQQGRCLEACVGLSWSVGASPHPSAPKRSMD
jgi:hypothetical protein